MTPFRWTDQFYIQSQIRLLLNQKKKMLIFPFKIIQSGNPSIPHVSSILTHFKRIIKGKKSKHQGTSNFGGKRPFWSKILTKEIWITLPQTTSQNNRSTILKIPISECILQQSTFLVTLPLILQMLIKIRTLITHFNCWGNAGEKIKWAHNFFLQPLMLNIYVILKS